MRKSNGTKAVSAVSSFDPPCVCAIRIAADGESPWADGRTPRAARQLGWRRWSTLTLPRIYVRTLNPTSADWNQIGGRHVAGAVQGWR